MILDLLNEDLLRQLGVVGHMALAMLLAGMVGYEREIAGKPAGFRTHMLVAGAASLFVGLGNALVANFQPGPDAALRYDPIRVIEAVITGISFLGAGTIFRARSGTAVAGLTTAASLLVSGAIGIAVASRQYAIAIGAMLLALLVLRVLAGVERRRESRRSE